MHRTNLRSCKTSKFIYDEWLRLQPVIFNKSKFLWVCVTVQWLAGPKAWHGAVKPEETTLPVLYSCFLSGNGWSQATARAAQAVAGCSRTRPQNKKAVTIYFGILTSSQHYHRWLRPPVAQKHTRHARRVSRHMHKNQPGMICLRFLFLLTGIMKESWLAKSWRALEWCGVLVNRYFWALIAGGKKGTSLSKHEWLEKQSIPAP